MALRAGYGQMRARQGEACLGMIEIRRAPPAGRVTDRAVRRKSRCHVIRIVGPREIRLVARIAIHRRIRVVAVEMTLQARERRVHARQRIARHCGVVERRVRPGSRRMANRAVGGKTGCHMRGIIRPVKIRLVAAIAVRGEGTEVIVHVALSAGYRHVRPGQREPRLCMIEYRRAPPTRCMTCRAAGGEPRAHVIGIRRRSEIRLVA